MSDTNCSSDNSYQLYQVDTLKAQRKGKYKEVDNLNTIYKKIVQYKMKNKIGENNWVSEYDVYKASKDKKQSKRFVKSIRTIGYDYKNFVNSNANIQNTEESMEHFINQNNGPDYNDNYDDYYNDYYDYNYWNENDYYYDQRYDDRFELRQSNSYSNDKYFW